MTVSPKLKRFLDKSGVEYSTENHPTAFTAQEVAASAHVKGREMVKCVMVDVDGRDVMAATTASQRVNLNRLREALDARRVRLENENEFRALFDDCEVGAMPPFGNLYGVPVVVDEALREDAEIVFNAGDHETVLRMHYADFERLVHPTTAAIADGP
jgi:Ala-tRNA(Pro) deacylase